SLNLTDDSVYNTTFGALNFSFRFEGVTYSGLSVLSVSSNGFVSIGGDNGDECCAGVPANLVGDAFGRIAAFWADMNPSNGGNVFLNTFNDIGGPEIDRVVITWDTVLYDNNLPIRYQIQMKSNGVIILGYNGYSLAGFNDDTLIGISPGGGAADPGSTDLSATMPFNSGAQPTIYELFIGTPPPIDVDQTNIVFAPNPTGGYRVTSTLCTPPVWETNYGASLGLSDDSVSNTTFGALNFSFPFGGTTFSGAAGFSVSSNGFVSIGGDNGDDCCFADVGTFLNDSFGRIAPMYTDLNPSFAGNVYLNTFSESGFGTTTRVVITWDTVYYDSNLPVSVQAQLFNDGTVLFGYQCNDNAGRYKDTLVGLTPAGGAADPGGSDLSATIPFNSGSVPTIYEFFVGNPPAVDLASRNLAFVPNGQGGYRVSGELCTPPIWEPNYGAPLALTDDSTFDTTFGFLNSFSFPFAGTTYSGAAILSIASNGFVSLGGSNGNGCCNGLPSDLVNQFPRIAPLWVDLNPSVAGQVYLNVFNDWGTPDADRIVITWDTVFFSTREAAVAQLQMLSNGTIVFGYKCSNVGNLNRDVLIGVSPGNGVADPGSTTYRTSIPFSTGAQPTIYQFYPGASGPIAIDFDQTNIVFEPLTTGGFHVAHEECGRGTVNAGAGTITDVLRLNGSIGSPISRVVDVAQNNAISVSLSTAPNGPVVNSRYVLWAWPGSTIHPTELTSGGQRLGCLVNPSPLNVGRMPQPFRCLMASGMPAAVCQNVTTLNSPHFAPFTVVKPTGFNHPIRVLLQAVLRDSRAANTLGYSVTNAITLNVQ
ncbi:MAG: hypothetical protein HYR85_11860, partial [Planctomycetes bacterium]|nr:hypothetical protein [Planctomycetota bacterium]